MIDLETLGTKPGCKILSIGAVVFNPMEPLRLYAQPVENIFYSSISTESQYTILTTDPSTLEWWSVQDDAAREEAFSGVLPIGEVLANFTRYLNMQLLITGLTKKDLYVWGNSASFDLKILEAAYDKCCLPVPWNYSNEMCFRTLKKLSATKAPAFVGVKHNALADAINQADHAIEIFTALDANGEDKEDGY